MGMLQTRVAALLSVWVYDWLSVLPVDGRVVSLINDTETSTTMAVVEVKRVVYIVFCGTNDVRDWYTNIKADQVQLMHGKGHKGFQAAYKSVHIRLLQALSHCSNRDDIILTGHSLGGALAHHCAVDCYRFWGYRLKSLITFGAPRSVDSDAAQYIETVTPIVSRYVYGNDVVSHIIPAEIFGCNYLHPGELILIDRNNGVSVNPVERWAELTAKAASALSCAPYLSRLFQGVTDHDMGNYLPNIGLGPSEGVP
jgi:predicted lipase